MSLGKWLVGVWMLQALNREADWQSMWWFPAQVRAAPPPPTQNHRRPAEKIEDVEITLVWWWLCPSVTATIKARLRVWPVLFFRHLCMMMTRTEQKQGGLYVTGWPGRLLPCFEYFVPFFVVIFYVISPTTAQILEGPRSTEGDSPLA